MPTLRDVAEAAGVSVNTVSRVFNGTTKATWPRVAKQAAEIRRIAAEMGYRPNLAARAMRTNKTYQIGLLVSELHNPSTGIKVEALEHHLLRHDYKVLLGLSGGRPQRLDTFLHDFAGGMVDGIINLDPNLTTKKLAAVAADLPVISFCRDEPGNPVQLDYAAGMRAALDHLWALGHRKIGFACGPLSDRGAKARASAFEAFGAGHGCSPDDTPTVCGDWTLESGRELGAELVKRGCTGIVCANDLLALGVIQSARSLDRRVPDDVSVIGYDDSPLAQLADPLLTSVRIPFADLAAATVEALLAVLRNEPAPDIKAFVPTLTIRGSAAARPAGSKID